MGVVNGISHDKFPKQGRHLHKRVKVCFNYNPNLIIMGTCVRNDVEQPYQSIIKLDDDRYVLATECMYSPES